MTSFHDLYTKYAADVYQFAYWLSGNAADAEDITSETFARAWTAADTLHAPTVKAYLFKIARHLFLRSRERGKRQVELSDNIEDPAQSPAHRAEVRDELQTVMGELQKLPEAERSSLMLRAGQNLSYEEIATTLNISVSAAKVNVHRARRKLSALRLRKDI